MKTALVLFLVLVLTSCGKDSSSNVAPSKIEQNYAMVYDSDAKVLVARADFQADGKSLELDHQSRILCDGEVLLKQTALNGRVSYELKKEGVERSTAMLPHVFEFTDNTGKVYRNEVRVPSEAAANYAYTRVNLKQDIPVQWRTFEPIRDGRVYLSVTRENTSRIPYDKIPGADWWSGPTEFKADEIQEGKERGTLTLSTGQFNRPGKYRSQICLEQPKRLQAGPAGGTLKAVQCSDATTIEVVP